MTLQIWGCLSCAQKMEALESGSACDILLER